MALATDEETGLLFSQPRTPAPYPDQATLAELGLLAVGTPDRAERSRRLFGKLRKSQGSIRFEDLLSGLEYLAHEGQPAGARLLAAFLDFSTVAERLIPRLEGLTSIRRYALILQADDRETNPFGRAWLDQLTRLADRAGLAGNAGPPPGGQPPGLEEIWARLRAAVAVAVQNLRDDVPVVEESLRLVSELFRLEVDALEERASRLAGIVDPFRVAGIQRLLPILSDLDARIRDSRHFIASLERQDLDPVFRVPQSRALEVMEPGEYQQLLKALRETASARHLSPMLEARARDPRSLTELAESVARLRWLGEGLAAARLPSSCADLLGATELALQAGTGSGIPLTEEESEAVATFLARSAGAELDEEARRFAAGLSLSADGCRLVLAATEEGAGTAWPHDLPAQAEGQLPDVDPAADPDAQQKPEDFGASEAKKLVLANLQSTSILLSLLRNAKVTSVPGLVAQVATRTRNPQVISTIANDRALHTGFANRDVPIACLRNPSNVSVKVLRRFVHVKFVSKVDLKRMSQDRAGIRRELRREIDRYLETLA